MDSQTLLNGFKALFSTLGAKTSNSNYAVPLVGANDGEPKGFMNMSNLASVLGVFDGFMSFKKNIDPNTFTFSDGLVVPTISGPLLSIAFSYNNPTSTSGFPAESGVCIYFMITSDVGAAIFISSLNEVYHRYCYGTWSGWKKVTSTAI